MTTTTSHPPIAGRAGPIACALLLAGLLACARQAPAGPGSSGPEETAEPAQDPDSGQSNGGEALDAASVEDAASTPPTMDAPVQAADAGAAGSGDASPDVCPGSWYYLPPGPKSSKKPCLCFAKGDDCMKITGGWEHDVPPDPDKACPPGEVCTGGVDVVFAWWNKDKFPFEPKGICERPCVNPDATVPGTGGCDPGSRCVPNAIGGLGSEPYAMAWVGVCSKGVPYWCPQWAPKKGDASGAGK